MDLRSIVTLHRSKIMQGETLDKEVAAFMEMVDDRGTVYQNDSGALVFERYIEPNVARCWLFFDNFTKSTFSMICKATDSFSGKCMLAYTDDSRMLKLLQRTRFTLIEQDGDVYVLLKHGLGSQQSS
jgi:hypothetical protein